VPQVQRVTDLTNRYEQFARENVFVDKRFVTGLNDKSRAESGYQSPKSRKEAFIVHNEDSAKDSSNRKSRKKIIGESILNL
jgi:hypothetical protein